MTSEENPILEVGLTGGIATGKSTVSGFLAEMGAFVVDADQVAHEIMEPGGLAYDGVVDRFGRRILDTEGRILRPLLAQTVFGDRTALADLNAIVHPKVRAVAAGRIREAAASGKSKIAIFDAALLVETGAHENFARLIVVTCSRETQIRRLRERGLTQRESVARIDVQASAEERLDLADHVIDTDRTLEETRLRTFQVYAKLLSTRTAAPS